MAEEDALKSLQERLRQSGLTSAETAPRRSRASRTPLDDKVDTFMGASLGDKVDDGIKPATNADSPPPPAIDLADDDEAEASVPKRRIKKTRARNAPTALDPALFNQFASAMSGAPTASKEEKDNDLTADKELASSPLPSPPKPTVQQALPPLSPPRPAATDPPRRVTLPPNPVDKDDKLTKELMEIKKTLAVERDKLDDFEALCGKLIDKDAPTARNLAQYIGGLLEKEDELDSVKKERANFSQRLKELQAELDKQKESYDELKNSAKAEQDDFMELQRQLKQTREDLEEKQATYNALLESSKTNLGDTQELEAKIAELQEALEKQLQLNETLQSSFEKSKQEATELEQKLDAATLMGSGTSTDDRSEELARQLSETQELLEEQRVRYDDLQTAFQGNNEQIESLKDELQQVRIASEEQKSEYNALVMSSGGADGKSEELVRQLSETQSELAKLQQAYEELESASKEAIPTDADQGVLNARISELEELLRQKDIELEELNANVKKIPSRLCDVSLPPELMKLEEEETRLMDAAEKELQMMEDLIRDQAEYIRKFEEQMRQEEEEMTQKLAELGLELKPLEREEKKELSAEKPQGEEIASEAE